MDGRLLICRKYPTIKARGRTFVPSPPFSDLLYQHLWSATAPALDMCNKSDGFRLYFTKKMKQWFAIFSLMSVLVSCKPDQEIDRGDEVYLQFELRNGGAYELMIQKQPQGMLPLRIIAGNGYLPDKVDQLILEMKKTKSRTFRFAACDAYGRKGIYYCDTLNTKRI